MLAENRIMIFLEEENKPNFIHIIIFCIFANNLRLWGRNSLTIDKKPIVSVIEFFLILQPFLCT